MNTQDFKSAFWGGFGGGFIACIMLLLGLSYFFDCSPLQVQRTMEKKAVSLGYGKYIITNTNNLTPTVEFQWVTNSVNK
jgi:hypothetical protein